MPQDTEVIENPQVIAAELRTFNESVAVFSSHTRRFIDEFDMQWVAVLEGSVVAKAADIDSLFLEMERDGIDSRYALVRHIRKNQRTLIV